MHGNISAAKLAAKLVFPVSTLQASVTLAFRQENHRRGMSHIKLGMTAVFEIFE